MSPHEARTLCKTLVRGPLRAAVVVIPDSGARYRSGVLLPYEWRVVFSGGTQGEHSLDVAASSEARILAHWAGYCENNGEVSS